MAKKQAMTVNVTLSEKDYLSFNINNSMKMIQAFIVYAVVFLFVLTKMGYYGDVSDGAELMGYLSKPLTMFVLFLGAYVGYIVYRAKSAYKKYPMIQQKHTYKLNKGQMFVATDNGEAKIKWDQVYRVIESREMFVVYSTRSHAHLITKKSFDSEENILEFRELLREAVPKKKLKIKK